MHVSTDTPTNPQIDIVLFIRTREIEGREGVYIYKKTIFCIFFKYILKRQGGGERPEYGGWCRPEIAQAHLIHTARVQTPSSSSGQHQYLYFCTSKASKMSTCATVTASAASIVSRKASAPSLTSPPPSVAEHCKCCTMYRVEWKRSNWNSMCLLQCACGGCGTTCYQMADENDRN